MKKGYLIISISALLLSFNHAFSQMPTDSLVAYYPLNGNANDSSGNGFNGNLGGQTPVPGKCAGAYKFSGNFISCGDPPGNEFDLVSDATISLWMKLHSVPSNGYYTLIGKDVGPGEFRKWFFATTKNELLFHINTSTVVSWATQPIFNFASDIFYHVVVTKKNNNYTFYVNGVSFGTKALFFNIVDVPSPLRIGDLKDGSVTLDATIDEVLIYHKVLNQAEIDWLYTNCPTGIITSTGDLSQSQQGDLKLFPNPSTGRFVLSLDHPLAFVKNLSVYNILGERISGLKQDIFNRDIIIDLGRHPRGTYFLQVQIGKKTVTRKIVVE